MKKARIQQPTPKLVNVGALLAEGIAKAGGLREMGRRLDWDPGSITKVRADDKLSPYRASQLAELTGRTPFSAVLATLSDGSKTSSEAVYWSHLPQQLAALVSDAAANALVRVASRSKENAQVLTIRALAALLREELSNELETAWTFRPSTSDLPRERQRRC